MRSVKGKVKNANPPHKLLYYTIMDSVCLLLFLNHLNIMDIEAETVLPENFQLKSNEKKIAWLNSICSSILNSVFF